MKPPGHVLVTATAAHAAVAFVNIALPAIGLEIAATYDLSLAQLGAVLSAPGVGSALALNLLAVAIRRLGLRATIAIGALLAVIGMLGAAFAGTAVTFGASLFVMGAGASTASLTGAAALFRVYPAERLGWAIGVQQMAMPVGGMTGAVLGPVLEAVGGVRLLLWVAAAGVAVTCFAFAAATDSTRATDHGGFALARIWRSPGVKRLLVAAGFYVLVMQLVVIYTVPSVRAAGLSSLAAGVTYFLMFSAAAAARIGWGRLADRQRGSRRVRTLVEIGATSVVGAGAFAFALHLGAIPTLSAALVLSAGALGSVGLLYVLAGECVAPALTGQSVALAGTVMFVASAAFAPPLGAVAEHAGWDVFWLAAAALALVGALVATRLPAAVRPPAAIA